MKEATFIFALLFLCFDSVAEQWTFYTDADGLAGNRIQAIQEDKQGYLWLATIFNGVSRYDGVHFETLNTLHGLASNNLYCFMIDKAGDFWFATDRGVSIHNGTGFTNFNVGKFADASVHFILEDRDGNFWFATDGGISIYNGIEFQDFAVDEFADTPVNFILEDRQGDLWFGTEKGAYKYTTGELRQFMEVEELADQSIRVISEDREGNLWFGTRDNGVVKYDEDERCQYFTHRDGLVDDSILAILQDSRGDLWFGTPTGVSRYDWIDFQNFTEISDTTALNFVRCIWEDRDENLWFGTVNGAVKYTMINLHPFKKADGLAGNSIRATLEDQDGNVWFGTENGVSRYDGSRFQNFMVGNRILSMLQDSSGNLWMGTMAGLYKNLFPIDEVKTPVITILDDKAGNLWYATRDGVGKYDETTFKTVCPIEDVSELFMDSRDNLWIGSGISGIHKYDGGNLKRYSEEDGLTGTHVIWFLETQDGDLLFGLENEGVYQYSYDDDSFKNVTSDEGNLSDSITVALEDSKGTLWFGTYEGVARKSIDHPITESQSITKAHGLIRNTVKSIFADSAANLWFGTDKGVSKYDGEHFQNISLAEHLTRGYINSIFEDSKGTMWFITTRSGVMRYTPPRKEIRPRIHITQIEADKIYRDVGEIKVSTTVERITLEYKGISFKTKPGKMRYTYKLEAHDKDWQFTDGKRIHYPLDNLKPGSYQFQVRAIDTDLHYSTPATVNVEIYRPFYQTPLFASSAIVAGICLLGGTCYLILQLNKQRQIAVQLGAAERVQAAKMASLRQLVAGVAHQVNNPIGAISSNTDVSERAINKLKDILTQKPTPELKADKQLIRTFTVLEQMNQMNHVASEGIAQIVDNLQRFVRLDEAEWQIADIHEGIGSVIALMRSELESGMQIIKDYGELPRIYCSPSSMNQVFMSLLRNASEAIEGEGTVEIRTFAQDENVIIEISDTGKGILADDLNRIFDPGFTTKDVKVGMGFGLSISYKIVVDEHKGRLDVSSESGEGTTFTITLPQRRGER